MEAGSINNLNHAILRMLRRPEKSLSVITDVASEDTIDNSTIASLAYLRKKLLSQIERNRSQLTLATLAYISQSLVKIDDFSPEMETFYCSAEEVKVLGRIMIWQLSKFIRAKLVNLRTSADEKTHLLSVRDAYGLEK